MYYFEPFPAQDFRCDDDNDGDDDDDFEDHNDDDDDDDGNGDDEGCDGDGNDVNDDDDDDDDKVGTRAASAGEQDFHCKEKRTFVLPLPPWTNVEM